MNRFEITGARLTKDPEVKYTPTQTAICNLIVAIDRYVKGEKKTDFPRITVFGKDAENLETYSAKGLRVNVFGRIETGSYLKNGETIYKTDLIAERVEIVDFKTKAESKGDIVLPDFKEIDGDIPF